MSAARFLPAESLPRLVESLAHAGYTVYGPTQRRERVEYARIVNATDLTLDSSLPVLPLKALFLPPTEPLLHWRRHGSDVALTAARPVATRTVVLGARPCDAAGVAALDKVMGWDYRDEAWFTRREATTIVAVACTTPGPDCFCEEVGLGPASTKGVDLLLAPVDGGYLARDCTEKGESLFDVAIDAFKTARLEPPSTSVGSCPSNPVAGRLNAIAWDDPVWDRIAVRCHGCGACAAVCPTCHCFDIVDEPHGVLGGTRRRNWDTCQAAGFTRHASGHNPRADQRARFRQRILHKFSIYPQRFGEVLCTGCGRCAAACPAGQNLPEILAELQHRAATVRGQSE